MENMAGEIDEDAPSMQKGKRVFKKPAMKQIAVTDVDGPLTAPQLKLLKEWKLESQKFQNSRAGKALDRRRNYVRSRVWCKLKTKMITAGVSLAYLSKQTQEILSGVHNIVKDTK